MFVQRLLSLFVGVLTTQVFAQAEIQNVTVEGGALATVRVQCVACSDRAPTIRVENNQIELVWNDAVLHARYNGKFEVGQPHALIQRMSLFSSDKNTVKGIVVIRGSSENLERRLQMSHGSAGTSLQIAYPNSTSAALALLQNEEEKPIVVKAASPKAITPKFGTFQLIGILVVVLLAAVTSVFGARFLRQKAHRGGSRRFLIEKLAQMPLESKASVCLLKVGSELVFVGVTGQQVSFLSSMPRLQEEYDSESRLERRAFRDAVEDEFRRLKDTPPLSA